MTQIDWSTSPDWAIGHGLVVSGSIKQVWFGEKAYMIVGDSRSYVYGGGTGETRHNHMRDAIQFQQLKPAPWNGSGLPPVGTVCMYPPSCGNLERCIVVAHIKDRVAFTCPDDHDSKRVYIESHPRQHKFVPIPSPAQLAAEEREKAIEDMWSVYWQPDVPTAKAALGLLWDAGYRKIEVKP